ncbi:hypothetical protein L9F63_016615, partial [Diploptera punctata]
YADRYLAIFMSPTDCHLRPNLILEIISQTFLLRLSINTHIRMWRTCGKELAKAMFTILYCFYRVFKYVFGIVMQESLQKVVNKMKSMMKDFCIGFNPKSYNP